MLDLPTVPAAVWQVALCDVQNFTSYGASLGHDDEFTSKEGTDILHVRASIPLFASKIALGSIHRHLAIRTCAEYLSGIVHPEGKLQLLAVHLGLASVRSKSRWQCDRSSAEERWNSRHCAAGPSARGSNRVPGMCLCRCRSTMTYVTKATV